MGFGYLFAGLCFFLTPCVNAVDVLPDVIGCLLMGKGLSKLSFLSDGMSEAKLALRRCLAVSCGKLAGLGAVALFRDETTTLLVTFVLSVLELIFFTPLFRFLAEGMEELGIRYESKNTADGAHTAGIVLRVFLWARCAGAVIPEMFCLWDPLYTGEFPPDYLLVSEALGRAKIVCSLFQFLLVGGFAVAVGLRLRRLFLGAAREKSFVARLQDEWQTRIGSNARLQEQLGVDRALGWLTAAALLSFRLYLNRLNYFPDFVFFLLLLTVLGLLPASLREGKRTKRLLWVCAVTATACFALRTYGAAVFYPFFGERWQALWAVYPAGILSALTLGAGLFLLIGMLDDCSLVLYGRRRVKTGFLKVLAAVMALCAFVEYALPSIYDFLRLVSADFPLYLKSAAEYVNIAFSALGTLACAVFILRVWVVSSAMREELKLEMKY